MSQWAEAIDELMSEYPLNLLLELRTIASSVFYYHLKQLMAKDKYAEEKENIRLIFHEHKGRYGYRRITTEMRNRNFVINHKTVQRLMQSMGLKSRIRKIRYRSYKGDVGKIAPILSTETLPLLEVVDVGRQTEVGVGAALVGRHHQFAVIDLKLHERQARSLIALGTGLSEEQDIVFRRAALLVNPGEQRRQLLEISRI